MKVIDTLTQEDFHGAFQKLLEQYNKCIAAGGDYFKGDWSFICVLSIKVWKLLMILESTCQELFYTKILENLLYSLSSFFLRNL